jgi:hypothetical protein
VVAKRVGGNVAGRRLLATTRGRLTVAGGVLVLAWSAWQAWLWHWRNEPVTAAADRISAAYENHDVDTLLYYSFPSELDIHGIDRRQFANVLREYCFPPMLGAKRARRVVRDGGRGEGQSVDCSQYYAVDGHEVVHSFGVVKTKDGPKTMVISPAIRTVFHLKYERKFSEYPQPIRRYRVQVEAIRQEAARLTKLGIKGQDGGLPGKPLGRWKEVKELFEWAIAVRGSAQAVPRSSQER